MLNELFAYEIINKAKNYIKLVNIIFDDIENLIKRLKVVVRENKDI